MPFILVKKDPVTQAVISETPYKSVLQIAKDLNTTYCCCYKNYLMNIGDVPPPKKRSQVNFNNRYTIKEVPIQ